MRVNCVREARFLAALGLMATGLLGLGCEPGGVGDPCVPEDEYVTTFSGYSVEQVNVESRSFQCLTRVCLVNHFQGRVSCPYGQSQATADACKANPAECAPGGPSHATSCRIPGQDGSDPNDQITVPVDPQLEERQAKDTVYCSCRCAGPDPNANYCECPSGFTCTELNPDVGVGRKQLVGSYCIKNGTAYDDNRDLGRNCDPTSANCGNGGANPPAGD